MKIAIITGASSGLGVCFAKEIDRKRSEIDEIWLIARREERLNEVAAALSKNTKVLPLDLKKDDSADIIAEELKKSNGDVALLVNNAGYGKLGDFSELSEEDCGGMIRLNCESLTRVTSAVLPFIKSGGEIINTCSIAAFAPNTRLAVYSSTKAYVMSFSKALRLELKSKNINCIAVCPGPMDTEFLPVAGISAGSSKAFDSLPRVLPEEMASGALKASKKKKAVYTNKLFYKFYRLVAKIIPTDLVMKMSKA